MQRISMIVCSGICFLSFTALTAQSPPRYKTLSNVVSYQIYQQIQWNYKQIPKNSIQYKLDYRHLIDPGKKINQPIRKLEPLSTPVIKKTFLQSISHLNTPTKSYLQKSRFLNYYLQKENVWTFLDLQRKYSF